MSVFRRCSEIRGCRNRLIALFGAEKYNLEIYSLLGTSRK